jgi:hypothetical protein
MFSYEIALHMDLTSKVVQRYVGALPKEAASSAAEKDMQLAFAFADVWPDKTLFNPQLRFEIYQQVRQHTRDMQYSVATATQKGLKTIWKQVAYEIRDLNYRSRTWLTPEQYIELMTAVCPQYNQFSIKNVAAGLLHPDTAGHHVGVQAARIGSPALYIKGDADILDWFRMVAGPDIMKAQKAELNGGKNILQLWWG